MKRHGKKRERERIKLWRLENSSLFSCFALTFNPLDDFDKYENVEFEKKFYLDQIDQRVMFISEEIDTEYEEVRSLYIAEQIQMELSHMFDDNDTETHNDSPHTSESVLTLSISRSGLVRQTKSVNSFGTQADLFNVQQPPVRKVEICTEEIKTALAEVSVAAQMSPEKARKAAQAFSKDFYGHQYYLSHSEKFPNQNPTPNKRPRTAEEYADYADIFLEDKVTSSHKHGQALQRECDAAKALHGKKLNEKVVLHFDSTSRDRIDGDWPSLILNILSLPKIKKKFSLRPLFFAYEDRKNICRLIVETLYRLAATVGTSPKTLQKKLPRLQRNEML